MPPIPALPPAEHLLDGPFLLAPPDAPVVRGWLEDKVANMSHVLYSLRSTTGILLKIFVFLTGTPLFGLIRNRLMRKNGFPQLLSETLIPERPMMSPLQPSTIPEAEQEPANTKLFQVLKDDEGAPQTRMQAAFAASAGLRSDARFPSIAEYYDAYKTGMAVLMVWVYGVYSCHCTAHTSSTLWGVRLQHHQFHQSSSSSHPPASPSCDPHHVPTPQDVSPRQTLHKPSLTP